MYNTGGLRVAGIQGVVTKPFRWSNLSKRMARYPPMPQPQVHDDPLDDLAVANSPDRERLPMPTLSNRW